MTDSTAEQSQSTLTIAEDTLPLQTLIKQKNDIGIENTTVKDYISKMASEIPDHIFHYEWFKEEENPSLQFIVIAKKLLPTLILGVEKLLREVEKKGLTEEQNVCPNFNPLNFLAQFMLRNHPRTLSVSERSTYIKMLQYVTKKINEQFGSETKPSLKKMKGKIQQRRMKREIKKANNREERRKHKISLNAQFCEWISPELPKLHISAVMKALITLDEMLTEPLDEYESLLRHLKVIQADKMVDEEAFSEFVLDYLDNSPATFEELLEHLSKSAEANLHSVNDEQERTVLLNLFMVCDDSMIGTIDRLQVLNFLEEFWSHCPDNLRDELNNPSTWPVIEVEETDMIAIDPSTEPSESFVVSDGERRGTEVEESESDDVHGDKTESGEHSATDNVTDDDDLSKNGKSNMVDKASRKSDDASRAESVIAEDDATAGDKANTDEDNTVEDNTVEDNTVVTGEGNAEDDLEEDDDEVDEEEEAEDEHRAKKSSFEYSSEFTSTGAEYSHVTSKTEDDNCQVINWLKKVFTQIEEVTESQENVWQKKMTDSLMKFEDSKESSENIKSLVSFVDEVTVFRDETSETETEHIAKDDSHVKKRSRRIAKVFPSAFDKHTLTASQFVQLLKSYLAEEHSEMIFDILVGCFSENYKEHQEDKIQRMRKVKQEAQQKYYAEISNNLFEMWDSDQSGLVSTKHIETVVNNYKATQEPESVQILEIELEMLKTKEYLTRQEVRQFILNIITKMPSNYKSFIERASSILISKSEVSRSCLRKEWYQKIINVGRTNGIDMSVVYDIIIKILFKDAEVHGGGKLISSYIALLTCGETADETFLKYVATSADQAEYLENKILHRSMNCISFICIDKGLPVHVPKVRSHGKIYFWNTNDKYNGSLLLIPLKNKKNLVFGLLGIDTLRCSNKGVFVGHEIKYYRGVAKAFSISYHRTKIRKWMVTVLEKGIRWMQRLCSQIGEVTIYIVEPILKENDLRVKTAMTVDSDGLTTVFHNPSVIRRKASLFKDYLFHCVDSSMTVVATTYGQHHIAYPLRGMDGMVYLIMDITTKQLINEMPNYEHNELLKILRLLQVAYKEIWHELWESEEPNRFLAAEQQKNNDALRVAVMFDRLLLMDLRENIATTEDSVYDELRNYHDPPHPFYSILKAAISILYPEANIIEGSDDWVWLKEFVKPELHVKIDEFDPTAKENDFDGNSIKKYLEDILPGTSRNLGYWPMEYFYTWLHVCVSLRELLKVEPHDITEVIESQRPSLQSK